MVEVLLHLKNVGSSTLVATNIRINIHYLTEDDVVSINENSDKSRPQDDRIGRLQFLHSLDKEIGKASWHHANKVSPPKKGPSFKKQRVLKGPGFLVVDHDTFVQPGVDQTYTFITAVPRSCRYIRIIASFYYAQHPGPILNFFLGLSRRMGLIQYSLSHITEPHVVVRAFRIEPDTKRLQQIDGTQRHSGTG
jgi:hypothetical protein